jgi:hypothetical protein
MFKFHAIASNGEHAALYPGFPGFFAPARHQSSASQLFMHQERSTLPKQHLLVIFAAH